MYVMLYYCDKGETRYELTTSKDDIIEIRNSIMEKCTGQSLLYYLPQEVKEEFTAVITYGTREIEIKLSNQMIYYEQTNSEDKILNRLLERVPTVDTEYNYKTGKLEVKGRVLEAYYMDNLFISEEDYLNKRNEFEKTYVSKKLASLYAKTVHPKGFVITSEPEEGRLSNILMKDPDKLRMIIDNAQCPVEVNNPFIFEHELRTYGKWNQQTKKVKFTVGINELENKNILQKHLVNLLETSNTVRYIDPYHLKIWKVTGTSDDYKLTEDWTMKNPEKQFMKRYSALKGK